MKRILLRLFIFILILFGIFFILDKVVYFLDKGNEDIYQINEINMWSSEKLTVNYCDYSQDDYTILHKGEELGKKTKKRILVVGDSLVWPHANRNMNTLFWMRLKYLLEKEGYNDVEIIGAGTSGLGTVDEVKLILENEEMIKKIDPDLIIIGFVLNDYIIANPNDNNYIEAFDRDRFIQDKYDNIFYRLLKKIYPNLYNKLIETVVDDASNTDEFNLKYGVKYGYSYDYKDYLSRQEKYLKLFEDEGIKKLSEIDIPLFIYELYFHYGSSYELEFLNMGKELSEKYNIPYYSNRKEYDENLYYKDDIREKLYQDGDGHPSELLNDFYANNILNILKNDYVNIIGKKTNIKNFTLDINDYLPYNINLIKENDSTYTFLWPDKYLVYPLEKNYVKLNLKYPVKISNIKIDSKNLKNVDIWYNKYLGDEDYIKIEKKDNNIFQVNDYVYSININVDLVNEKDRKIKFVIE